MNDRQKILIVDDKEENLYALEKVLEKVDADIIKAFSGNDALIASLNHEFALAILDVQMPGMDGYELAEFIRAAEKTRHVPIIFMSAVYSDDYYVFKGYDAGGVDYMVKPYNPAVLLSKVNVFLQLHRQHTELLKHREHLKEQVEHRTVELQKEITERKQAQEELEQHRNHLEGKVRERTAELQKTINLM
ncbi:MAG: response regulator, partial [Desulfobacterales bacterium]|nr:response regulator [Desulfobacterales bacterium]